MRTYLFFALTLLSPYNAHAGTEKYSDFINTRISNTLKNCKIFPQESFLDTFKKKEKYPVKIEDFVPTGQARILLDEAAEKEKMYDASVDTLSLLILDLENDVYEQINSAGNKNPTRLGAEWVGSSKNYWESQTTLVFSCARVFKHQLESKAKLTLGAAEIVAVLDSEQSSENKNTMLASYGKFNFRFSEMMNGGNSADNLKAHSAVLSFLLSENNAEKSIKNGFGVLSRVTGWFVEVGAGKTIQDSYSGSAGGKLLFLPFNIEQGASTGYISNTTGSHKDFIFFLQEPIDKKNLKKLPSFYEVIEYFEGSKKISTAHFGRNSTKFEIIVSTGPFTKDICENGDWKADIDGILFQPKPTWSESSCTVKIIRGDNLKNGVLNISLGFSPFTNSPLANSRRINFVHTLSNADFPEDSY